MADVKVKQYAEILSCKCKHKQQDELHGEGKRVMCPTGVLGTYRCTVCGEKTIKGK